MHCASGRSLVVGDLWNAREDVRPTSRAATRDWHSKLRIPTKRKERLQCTVFLLPFGFGLVWSLRFTAILRLRSPSILSLSFLFFFSISRQTAFSDASALHSMHVCMVSSTQPVASTPLIWAVATAGRGQPAFEYFNIKVFVSLSCVVCQNCWREALLPGIRRLNNKEND